MTTENAEIPLVPKPAYWLRLLFFALIIRPLVLIVVGLNIRHRIRIPRRGPAIVIANHNSHLDAMTLMSLFPFWLLPKIRPAAAEDYFMKPGFMAWFSSRIVGVIPVRRRKPGDGLSLSFDPLAGISQALRDGSIVIFFPEGTRGEPERMVKFKSGIAVLAERHPEVPVVPVFLHGLGKVLPKDDPILVPFFCDVFVGRHLKWTGERAGYMEEIQRRMTELSSEAEFPDWD